MTAFPTLLGLTEQAVINALRAYGINDTWTIYVYGSYSTSGGYSDATGLGNENTTNPDPKFWWKGASTVTADGTMSWQQPYPGHDYDPTTLGGYINVDVWGVDNDTVDFGLTDPNQTTLAGWEAAKLVTAPTTPLTLPETPEAFTTAWSSGLHVGDKSPRMVVEVRRGRWDRDHVTIDAGDALTATIYGETDTAPWMATWDPAETWLEVPGIVDYSEQQAFSENGCQIVTLTMDNVRFTTATGSGELSYHLLERGFASPTRSYDAPGRTADARAANEWYNRLGRMAQIRVWQGYGDPERGSAVNGSTMPTDGGTNGMWVFMGQLDDIDLTDAPDHITLTARNGQPLTDQEFFGWSKSSQLKEPVVFADRTEASGNPAAARWILVDDVSDIVRVILRWAGYHDTAIETTGVRMKGHKAYNRLNKLIEPINDICEQTGYSFYFTRPLDGESLALPVFRMNGSRDAAPTGMPEITEDDLLTAIDYKQSMAPLAYIIRIRGKEVAATSGGVTLGGDTSTRVMATYRPPWSFQPGDPDLLEDRLGGLLKHVTLTFPQLKTSAECLTQAKLLALNEALGEVQAIIEIPGHPGLMLDDQVGVTDSTAAVNSRLWVSERSNTFTTGETTTWKTTLTGPLLDFPDVAAMLAEL